MALMQDPAKRGSAVTPSDSTLLGSVRALYVGGAGDLVVEFSGNEGTNITLAAVPAGTLLPIRVSRVRAATTATNIVALY